MHLLHACSSMHIWTLPHQKPPMSLLLFLVFVSSLFLRCNGERAVEWRLFPALARRALQSKGTGNGLYETRHFTQTLDHFNYNPQASMTFQQRYLVNATHWGGSGAPIFLYTGGVGSIELLAQNTGFMFDIAPLFKALLVFVEHRYYGESVPFGSKEPYSNASTLGYLSSTQALADYATLIVDLKKNLSSEESPVVAFGGSYGGMLAAWFRLKYPHIVTGALASSAPILQFDGLVSPYTFNDIITNDFRSESESCYRTIKNSWTLLKDALQQPGGPEKLAMAFKLCSRDEAAGLEDWLYDAYVSAAVTDYPIASRFLTPLPAHPVKHMCKAIDNPASGNDTFSRLYGAMNIYYNYTGTAKCFEIDSTIAPPLARWYWQLCTEMVLLTGGSTNESIFPAHTYHYTDKLQFCKKYYNITPRPHWITTEFGGHHCKRVLKRFGSNIIFFNGLRDPWSGGGVLESINPSITAIVAPQGARHVDLRFATTEDPAWLSKVREKEVQIIARWIKQYYADL